MARATLKTIAQHTGLSITTVSRALKDGPEVKPNTIAVVKEAAEALGYRPNASGLSLRTGKSFVVAVILPVPRPGEVLGDIGSLPLMEGLTSTLKDSPYHLTIIPKRAEETELEAVSYVVENEIADGVIITTTRPQDERVKYLLEKQFPFVTFGRTELSSAHPYYDVDNYDFAYEAAKRLIGLGHQRLLMVTPPIDFMYSWHRVCGFRRALMENGLDFDQSRDILLETSALDYKDFAFQFASSPKGPTGFICTSELSALGILTGVQSAGKTIGREVDVVTLETSSLPAFFNPPLTGYFQDLHVAGRRLAEIMLKVLEGEDPAQQNLLERVTVVER